MTHKIHIVCLYQFTRYSGLYFDPERFEVFNYDLQHVGETTKDNQHFIHWNALNDAQNQDIVDRHSGNCPLLMSFPPCTDLAVSGAAHFANKFKANPNYRAEAIDLVTRGDAMGAAIAVSHFSENPVSVLSTNWRKPDHMFHPFEYGGYLSSDDTHPDYPEYIAPRDAYTKRTCLWTGGSFQMPPKLPVVCLESGDGVKQHSQLGGKSLKTKNIRSATARGFAKALAQFYSGGLR